MTEYLHDEWLYDLHTYQYSRALRSAKKQKNVPELVLTLVQLMAERRELNIQPIMNQKLKTDLLDATGQASQRADHRLHSGGESCYLSDLYALD